MVLRYELVVVENLVAQTTSSGGHGEKMKIAHNGIRSTFDGLHMFHDGESEVRTSSDLCKKLFSTLPVVDSYTRDIPEGNHIWGV